MNSIDARTRRPVYRARRGTIPTASRVSRVAALGREFVEVTGPGLRLVTHRRNVSA